MKSGTSIRSAFRMLLLSYSVPLHVLIPNEEKKLPYIFIFTLLCGASKGFVKAILIQLSEIIGQEALMAVFHACMVMLVFMNYFEVSFG